MIPLERISRMTAGAASADRIAIGMSAVAGIALKLAQHLGPR